MREKQRDGNDVDVVLEAVSDDASHGEHLGQARRLCIHRIDLKCVCVCVCVCACVSERVSECVWERK